jgi:deoxycytidylate deaminase
MGGSAVPNVARGPSGDSASDLVDKSKSYDLVFGFVGYAGSGCGLVSSKVAEHVTRHGYAPVTIAISDEIVSLATKRAYPAVSELSTGTKIQRAIAKQGAGNWLRATYGESITAAIAIRKMKSIRATGPATRRAYLVDQLKHPDEVELLRNVYGSSFYLISVVCRPETRIARLRVKFKDGLTTPELTSFMSRDEKDSVDEGQHVRKTIFKGDYFVNNDADSTALNKLDEHLERMLELVTAETVGRPNQDERGMYAAWTASLRSSCLSRQVGASIVDNFGNLVSTGTNDAPRAGGGLYEEDRAPDHRCFADEGFCRNDRVKEQIFEDLAGAMRDAGLLKSDIGNDQIRKAVEKTPIRDLIEFSRAIHAEMDAILSAVRTLTRGVVGGTLYCTTYPCHSCARHIVAAGLDEVVYIEPYPKSRALELHADSISDDTQMNSAAPVRSRAEVEGTQPKKVVFRLFSGVAPRRYAALFEKRSELKDKTGKLLRLERKDTKHTNPILDKSFLELESAIAKLADDADSEAKP